MKELSIEEKARRYDEAIEIAKRINNEQQAQPFNIMTRVFPELKESEDEKIRKALVEMVHDTTGDSLWVDYNVHKEEAIAWLEKQAEHANFRNKIQIGDKVTRNEDGVLVNLSQLKRVAKKDEKQGEQKSFAKYKVGDTIYYNSFGRLVNFVIANIVEDGTDNPMYEDKDGNSVFQNDIVEQKPADEPKFKVGAWITIDKPCQIISINDNGNYIVQYCDDEKTHELSKNFCESHFHIWSIKDAKDGDVLINTSAKYPFIFKQLKPSDIKTDIKNPLTVLGHCGIGGAGFTKSEGWGDTANCAYYPATKEQRDALMKAMADAGYTFD